MLKLLSTKRKQLSKYQFSSKFWGRKKTPPGGVSKESHRALSGAFENYSFWRCMKLSKLPSAKRNHSTWSRWKLR